MPELVLTMGSGGGHMVSVLAFYSVDPGLNPAEVYSFYSVKWFEMNKCKQNRGRRWPIYKNCFRPIKLALLASK